MQPSRPYDERVSVFRPSVRVTGSDGRDWEVYAYRMKLPERRATAGPGLDSDAPVGLTPGNAPYAEYEAAGSVVDAVLWLLGLVPRLLVRLLWDVPRAGLQALGSDEWTIEAITWEPHRTSFTWRTTGEFRGHVLAQVEGQLARGETPRPQHATFVGADG